MSKQSKEIKHRISGGCIYYSSIGITFKPYIFWKPLVIPWSEIDFISPTPAVRLIGSNWHTFDKRDLMLDNALENLTIFTLHIVLKDYKKVRYNRFLRSILDFKRLLNANDEIHKKRASINYKLKKKTLDVPLRTLLHFIDKHSKYDLLILGDSFFP